MLSFSMDRNSIVYFQGHSYMVKFNFEETSFVPQDILFSGFTSHTWMLFTSFPGLFLLFALAAVTLVLWDSVHTVVWTRFSRKYQGASFMGLFATHILSLVKCLFRPFCILIWLSFLTLSNVSILLDPNPFLYSNLKPFSSNVWLATVFIIVFEVQVFVILNFKKYWLYL